MSKKEYYEGKAIEYAEHYGIITYRVTNNKLVYNQNYHNNEFINGNWIDKPCTYQRTVNLDTGEETSKKLQRLQKNGWDNV